MRTSPAPGFGISRSTISKSPPGFEICATFIGAIPTFVVAIISPLNFQQILISLCDRSVAYLRSSTLDSRRDRPVTNYFLNAWVLRTDKTNLHAKNQRSVTGTGAALPRFARQSRYVSHVYLWATSNRYRPCLLTESDQPPSGSLYDELRYQRIR